jgi:hypothetical protein
VSPNVSYAALVDSFRIKISAVRYIIVNVYEDIQEILLSLLIPVIMSRKEMLHAMSIEFILQRNVPYYIGLQH